MSCLHVALQEGFADDTVVCRINGRDVYGKEGPRLQIGHADSFESEVPHQVLASVLDDIDARCEAYRRGQNPERHQEDTSCALHCRY